MNSNSEPDCNNIETSASPAPSKSKKRTRKASGSKIQIGQKSVSKSEDKKARANTRSSKQATVSASSFIDNLKAASSKESASLRSNSNGEDFAELELINSSVPFTPESNEGLHGVS